MSTPTITKISVTLTLPKETGSGNVTGSFEANWISSKGQYDMDSTQNTTTYGNGYVKADAENWRIWCFGGSGDWPEIAILVRDPEDPNNVEGNYERWPAGASGTGGITDIT